MRGVSQRIGSSGRSHTEHELFLLAGGGETARGKLATEVLDLHLLNKNGAAPATGRGRLCATGHRPGKLI